ncbi:MAG: dTDP-4-dehydrorhamnose 3,5-epimerase [Candidatus Shapirobacteria bacterium]|jgi:dTDP-4-dehydrorhamnose 3,5-epimerase
MTFTTLSLPGLILIEPQVFGDNRGFFLESYNAKVFAENGITTQFIQDNHSQSQNNILRGLHLQLPPFAQTKLVRVTRGQVLDVVVDARPNSPTYKKFEMVELSESNKRQLYIPAGFLHGFLTQSPIVDFQYKVDNYYSKESEIGVLWNDPDINISWPANNPELSAKDAINPRIAEVEEKLSIFKN